MHRPSPAINKRCRATHQWIMFMAESRDVTLKTTAQNLIVRTSKSEDEITNNQKPLAVLYTVEANYWQTRSVARPLCDSSFLLCLRGLVWEAYYRSHWDLVWEIPRKETNFSLQMMLFDPLLALFLEFISLSCIYATVFFFSYACHLL